MGLWWQDRPPAQGTLPTWGSTREARAPPPGRSEKIDPCRGRPSRTGTVPGQPTKEPGELGWFVPAWGWRGRLRISAWTSDMARGVYRLLSLRTDRGIGGA